MQLDELRQKLTEAKEEGRTYEVDTIHRKLFRWYLGDHLLRLDRHIHLDIDLPDGLYEIYDVEYDHLYLYFNPEEVRWRTIRFVVDKKKRRINNIINIEVVPLNYGDYDKAYRIFRGMDDRLTLVSCEDFH